MQYDYFTQYFQLITENTKFNYWVRFIQSFIVYIIPWVQFTALLPVKMKIGGGVIPISPL